MCSPFSSCNTHITEQHLTTGPFIYPHWFPIDASPYDWGPKESPPRGPFNNKRSQLRQQAASLNEQQCHSCSVRACVCVSVLYVCVCVVKHHWLVAAEWSCDQGPLMTVRSCELNVSVLPWLVNIMLTILFDPQDQRQGLNTSLRLGEVTQKEEVRFKMKFYKRCEPVDVCDLLISVVIKCVKLKTRTTVWATDSKHQT